MASRSWIPSLFQRDLSDKETLSSKVNSVILPVVVIMTVAFSISYRELNKIAGID